MSKNHFSNTIPSFSPFFVGAIKQKAILSIKYMESKMFLYIHFSCNR